eukprot:11121749-Lingulodinium_polyedra.AAC.1
MLTSTRAGAVVYRAAWMLTWGPWLKDWLLRTSAQRRWLVGLNSEWRLVGATSTANATCDVLRLLAGGA